MDIQGSVVIRSAVPADVRAIAALVEPYAADRRLLAKDLVVYYESIQEFVVVESNGCVMGCGALHVLWEDLAEVRTVAVDGASRGRGLGHQLVTALMDRARTLGIERVFCLTFEVNFFGRHGFSELTGEAVTPEVYAELLRSPDDGVAEFLDLARVKPNTLGNTRMLAHV